MRRSRASSPIFIKMAMIAIDKKMQEEQVRSRMILQIHDEPIFDVPEDEVEQMMRIVEGMQNVVKLKVPSSPMRASAAPGMRRSRCAYA